MLLTSPPLFHAVQFRTLGFGLIKKKKRRKVKLFATRLGEGYWRNQLEQTLHVALSSVIETAVFLNIYVAPYFWSFSFRRALCLSVSYYCCTKHRIKPHRAQLFLLFSSAVESILPAPPLAHKWRQLDRVSALILSWKHVKAVGAKLPCHTFDFNAGGRASCVRLQALRELV